MPTRKNFRKEEKQKEAIERQVEAWVKGTPFLAPYPDNTKLDKRDFFKRYGLTPEKLTKEQLKKVT